MISSNDKSSHGRPSRELCRLLQDQRGRYGVFEKENWIGCPANPESGKNLIWIILGSCLIVILLALCVFYVYVSLCCDVHRYRIKSRSKKQSTTGNAENQKLLEKSGWEWATQSLEDLKITISDAVHPCVLFFILWTKFVFCFVSMH